MQRKFINNKMNDGTRGDAGLSLQAPALAKMQGERAADDEFIEKEGKTA